MQLVAFWPVLEVGRYGPEPGTNRFIGCTVKFLGPSAESCIENSQHLSMKR